MPGALQARQQLATASLGRRRPRRRRAVAAAAEQTPEGVAEVAVEARIDDGVERRVGVADPEERRDAPVGQLRARVGTQRRREVPREERQPADEERAHDDAQRLGRLVLALHPPLTRRLPAPRAGVERRPALIERRDAQSTRSAGGGHQTAAVGVGGGRRQVDAGGGARRAEPGRRQALHARRRRWQRADQRGDLLLLAARLAVDFHVREDHDDGRRPERDRRRDDAVHAVHLTTSSGAGLEHSTQSWISDSAPDSVL